MSMDADARLAAAAGGVARFLADAAGLETDAAKRLQLAVIDACKEDFKFLAVNHSHLEIIFARFSNRLEISLSHQQENGAPSAPQPDAGSAPQKGESKANSADLPGVDLIQHETHGKKAVTRLTKYFGHDSYPSAT